jgi:membrane protein implicated in regulation of membrane protease activity
MLQYILPEHWAAFGILCILVEVLFLQALGFLVIGLASITLSVFLYMLGSYEDYQFILFALFVLLWSPLLFFMSRKRKRGLQSGTSDLIGLEVVVVSDILGPGTHGSVTWSGTEFNAIGDDSIRVPAQKGSTLVVRSVSGNVLLCGLKHK